MDRIRLGLSIGYSGARMQVPVEKVQLAERLGFDSVWTAEAYGSDAITPLAYLAAVTKRIRDRFKAWEGSGITGLSIRTDQDEALELMAEITGASRAVPAPA